MADEMDDCCANPTGREALCPRCRAAGAFVGPAPVLAHRPDAAAGDWHHCSTESCHVVFFLDDDTVPEDEVVARVGAKATDKPIPVCYCFAHTSADITADLVAHHGASTISSDVRAAVASGTCACQRLNPNGKCCLPDIHRLVSAARQPPPAATSTDRTARR